MYICMGYTQNNGKLIFPTVFENEDDAWDFIKQLMEQPMHPKMMWVKKGVEADVGPDLDDGNTDC